MKLRNLFSRRHTSSLADTDEDSIPAPPTPVPEPDVVAGPPFIPGEAQRIVLGPDAVWDTEANTHMLIAGPQDTGKSTLQRRVLDHCIQHKDEWRIYGMDLYQTQFTDYVDYGTPVEHIAHDVSSSILDLRLIQDEMRSRVIRMGKHGYKSYRELGGKIPSIMVVIDETYHVLPVIMTPAERAAAKFDVRIEALNILQELAVNGSRAGIHISMASCVPAERITDALRKTMTCRVVTGALPAETSQLMLGTDDAVGLMTGQGYIATGKQGKTFTIFNSSS